MVFFIESLSGFPGPYSSYIFNTIGNNGILKLIGDNRDAQFVAVIAFCDSSSEPILFESSVPGTISKNIQDGVGVMIQYLSKKHKTRLMQN